MNQTKELWGPFSNALRRALLSTSRFEFSNFNRNFNAQIHFLNSTPSSSSSSSYSFQDPNSCSRRLFFEKINFCSESAAERAKIATCWSCNAVPKAAPFLFCESCRSVQPVDHSVDYFQIFGLKKNYEIEGENLEGKYKDWQKKLHPDLVHSKSEKEREYAAEQSARVIEAYRTLTKPLPRAIYILRLKGVDVDEEETVSEPELLTEILEIREAVEEATDSRALKEIQSLVQEKLIHWANCFANAFENQRFDEARVCVRRMTYYDRVNEEIAKKL